MKMSDKMILLECLEGSKSDHILLPAKHGMEIAVLMEVSFVFYRAFFEKEKSKYL
jgi:hypothetical protein